MKKVIIAAVISCVAVLAQAGSVKWGSIAMYNDSDTKVKSSATMYVYLVDSATYATMDAWDAYGSDVIAGGAGAANPGGKASSSATHKASVVTLDGATSPNTTYYAALIVTIGTGDNMLYYAEKAAVTTGDDGTGAYSIFGQGALDSAAAAKSAWKPAVDVPEPTSGLLLLVGSALLALRRKQK